MEERLEAEGKGAGATLDEMEAAWGRVKLEVRS
jgi:hypothetical protein